MHTCYDDDDGGVTLRRCSYDDEIYVQMMTTDSTSRSYVSGYENAAEILSCYCKPKSSPSYVF